MSQREMTTTILDVEFEGVHLHHYPDFSGEAHIVFVAKEGDDTYEGTTDGWEQIDLPSGLLKALREA